MADLIDRQAAIDDLQDMYHAAEKWGKEASDDVIKARAESCMASLIEMKLRIEKLPTAEPKTGRWKSDRLVSTNGGTYGVRRCSECGAYYQDIGYGWNFCPNCGARMEGEADEH